jgi:hypothetical protein
MIEPVRDPPLRPEFAFVHHLGWISLGGDFESTLNPIPLIAHSIFLSLGDSPEPPSDSPYCGLMRYFGAG